MRKLGAFMFLSLNGFFEGTKGDISWHKNDDPEKNEYAMEGLKTQSTLLFGRITYEMMASFWPSPAAMSAAPAMAEGMNRAEKIVFSRTLEKTGWNNTRLLHGDLATEVTKLKNSPGSDLTILGSGSILSQLADLALIDEYEFMIDPLAIVKGTPVFSNIKKQLNLELKEAKTFRSGVVVLRYQPVKS